MSKWLLQKVFSCPPPSSPHLCLTRTPVQGAISVLVEEQSGCLWELRPTRRRLQHPESSSSNSRSPRDLNLGHCNPTTTTTITPPPKPTTITTPLPPPFPLLPLLYYPPHLPWPDLQLTTSLLLSVFALYMKLNRVDQCIAIKMYTLNIICLSVLFWAKRWHYEILFLAQYHIVMPQLVLPTAVIWERGLYVPNWLWWVGGNCWFWQSDYWHQMFCLYPDQG